MANIDQKTVKGFGQEWACYTQTAIIDKELQELFERYFSVFPWDKLSEQACGFDMGCGSGRWAKYVAGRVHKLFCIDASEQALSVCRANVKNESNVEVKKGSFDGIPLEDNAMDFGYSLGVLHHIPDPLLGLKSCVKKLKRGAPFLLYIYYSLDNRPLWFKVLWRMTDLFRVVISCLPFPIKKIITTLIAATVYFPLARLSRLLEFFKLPIKNFPLMYYRHHSFYTMCTDAMDRFGTRLEKRFSADEIVDMMKKSGLDNIVVSDREPYWCAVGYKQ